MNAVLNITLKYNILYSAVNSFQTNIKVVNRVNDHAKKVYEYTTKIPLEIIINKDMGLKIFTYSDNIIIPNVNIHISISKKSEQHLTKNTSQHRSQSMKHTLNQFQLSQINL